MNNTRNVSTPSLHVFFLLFHIMMIWRNSNINLHNIYYVQRRQRKREMRSWLFFMCFKCTYKLLLCPGALLFIHHFIIKSLHHLLSALKTWYQLFMTCDKGSTLQEATSGSTNLLGLICGCKYCFQIPKASHQSSIGESKILGNDDFVANTL